MKVKLNSR